MYRGIYSPYKAVHYSKKIETLKKGDFISPTQVQLDLTSRCNHSCQHCYYQFYNTNKDIPIERALSLIDEIKEMGAVLQLTGGGEPLLYTDIGRVLEKIVKKKVSYALVTNGTLANYEHLDLFLKADWIRISLDAATPAVYAEVHGCKEDGFYQAQSFMHRLRNMKDKSNTIIGMSFMVSPKNYKEIVEATQLAKSLGADNIRISLVYLCAGIKLFSGILNELEELGREAEKLATNGFQVINLIPHAVKNLQMQDKNYSTCYYQQFTAVIGSDLELYPCCTLKYSEYKLGSIAEKAFKDVWFGDTRKQWLQSSYITAVCQKNPCGMDMKNIFMNYLTMKNPLCIEYI